MSCLFKLWPLYSNSRHSLFHFRAPKLQYFRFSILSRQSKYPNVKNDEETQMENRQERKEFSNLFDEITQILGTHNLELDKTVYGFPPSEAELNVSIPKTNENCTAAVCENASTANEQEKDKSNSTSLEEIQTGHLVERDASLIVHKFVQILRAEDNADSIEEQLEKSGIEFDLDVVDKVLKRCFKVPHLALRFFNWVKIKNGFCHKTETFNTMIYIAGESKEFGLVEELVEEMERNTCKKDVKTWTILISHYGKAKIISKVLLLFEKMKKSGLEPDLVVYKLVLSSLCDGEKADIAMEFYKEMIYRKMELDMNLYKLLLKCLARSGDIDSVHLVADDMIKISQIPEQHVFTCVLRSFCISGRIREALEGIQDLKNKNFTIDSQSFEILVKGLCCADRITDALEIVDILKKRDVGEKIYGLIVNGYLRRNDISKAFEVFQSIKDSGHIPTVSTYTELIQHLFKLSEFQKAFDLYNEMLEKGLELDSVAITAVVAGHVKQNHISEAWEVFKSMEKKGIRATRKSYIVFIKELCKVSKTEEIINVLDDMQASKVVVGDDAFRWVIAYLDKKGEMKKREKVKQMQRASKSLCPNEGETTQKLSLDSSSNQIDPEILNSHLTSTPQKSFCDHDLQEISEILSSPMNWCSKEEALEKCSLSLGFTPELVVEILRNCSLHGGAVLQFFSWVGKQTGYRHTSEAYNMAIKIAGRGKDFKHMRSLFFEMKRQGFLITSDTWNIMIMQYGRIGLTEIALRIFKEMKDSGCKSNNSTYKSLIISLCGKKGRKVNEAIQTFQEMIKANCIPDKELVETYLGCLCEVGKLLDARKCTEYLRRVGFTTPLAYSLYIRALCRAGRVEEALPMVDEVGKDRNTLSQYVFGSIVHALLHEGRLEEALTYIESMKQVGIKPTVHVYTSLIVYFFKEKKTDKAMEIFKKMKEGGCEPTIVTYSMLIRGYMDMGKIDDAWNVFHQMKSKGPLPDFKTYSTFISCLCKGGKSEEALQLISEMLNVGIIPSTVNFRNVYFGLNREGKQDLAQTVLRKKWDLTSKRKVLT